MNGPDDREDNEIISSILEGNTDDFEVLLNRWRGYVFKIVSGHLPYDEVPDLAHEVFIEVFDSLPKFDRRKTIFKKWLAGIAIHLCYDYWRKRYSSREIPMSGLSEENQQWLDKAIAAQSGAVFAGRENEMQVREILHKALDGISPADRMVLTLVHLEGFSIKEAAQVLGWTTLNVKVRAYRSRQKMRKHIALLMEGGKQS